MSGNILNKGGWPDSPYLYFCLINSTRFDDHEVYVLCPVMSSTKEVDRIPLTFISVLSTPQDLMIMRSTFYVR